MSATATLTQLVTAAMKPHAGAGGYKKDKLTYRRVRGETLQLVHFQLSQGNHASEATCYVNVGVAFPALFALAGEPTPERLKEYECAWRARLEKLVDGAPDRWTVDATTDVAAVGARLTEHLGRAAAWLDVIDGPAAMLSREPLTYGTQCFLRAQLHYVMGDLDASLSAVRAGVSFFADRGMSVPEQIRRHNLLGLVGRE